MILKHAYFQGIYLDIGPNCIAMQKCTRDLTPTTASAVIWTVELPIDMSMSKVLHYHAYYN
jgi:hypothetical protein